MRNFLLILLLLFSTKIFATEPLIDLFVYNDRSGVIYPEDCCWLDLPKNEKLQSLVEAEFGCSAIGGPRGKYKYDNDSLWLTGLYGCSKEYTVNEVYPELTTPALATWLNGVIIGKLDRICMRPGKATIYRTVLTLAVENGKIISQEREEHDESECKE